MLTRSLQNSGTQLTPSSEVVVDAHGDSGEENHTPFGVSVRVLRNLQEVEEIRGVWSAWNRHPNSDIDFYSMVLRSRVEMLGPHILVCYRNTCPDALLVGRIERAHLEFRLGYKTLWQAPVRQLTLIHGGALGNLTTANCQAFVREIRNSLRRGEADLAFLNHVPTDSPLYASASQSPGFLSRDHFPTVAVQRSTTLPASVEELFRGLSRKVRKNLKWQAKKIVEDFGGEVRIRGFRGIAELDELTRDVEEIARKTYQRGLGVGFIDDDNMRPRLRFEAERGWLRAHVLYVTGKACAFWIGSLYGWTFYSSFMGYDPAYAKYSPGMYLIMKTVEGFINRSGTTGPSQIDWGLGDAQYKEVLGNRDWKEAPLYIFAPTFRGIRLSALRTPLALTDRTLRNVLERSALLSKVKKIWRSRARHSPAVAQQQTAQPRGDIHDGIGT